MLYSPKPMHIPDGFLSTPVALALWALSVLFVAVALAQSRRQLGERLIPLMGVLAAFIFAAQAINFPVAAGTSGHLLGAALAAILLGPWPAVLVMTCVVIVQGLLFQDGGLLAMGGNLLNMAILSPLLAATLYRFATSLLGGTRSARITAAFFASWLVVVTGAMAAALQLAASATAPLAVVLPAMTLVHMLIGLGEGIITVGALTFLERVRPELVEPQARAAGATSAGFVGGGLVFALVVALFSPLASPLPDGLDTVAERLQFAEQARAPLLALFPDYTIPLLASPAASTMAAVLLGTLFAFALAAILGRWIERQAVSAEQATATAPGR